MKDTSILISGIEYKIKMLAEKNKSLSEENKILKQKQSEINALVHLQQNELDLLKEKTSVLEVSKTFGSDTERQSAKNTINELVREIDECLNLLNK